MARIPYPEEIGLDPAAAETLATIAAGLDRSTGTAMHDATQAPYVFRALAHSPAVLEAMWKLLGTLWQGTDLDRKLQELVILRVAFVRRSNYEWGRHVRVAAAVGLSDEKVAAVRRFPNAPELTAAERAAVALADEIAREGEASERTVEAVLEYFSERQLVELTLVASAYVMVACFLATVAVDQEEGDALVPE